MAVAATPSLAPESLSIWRSPLVPVALAATAGVLADRSFSIPLAVSWLTAAAGLLAWFVTRSGSAAGLPLVYLGLAIAALGAAHHHRHMHVYPADDVGALAAEGPRLVCLRGILEEEPFVRVRPRHDPLLTFQRADSTWGVLQATAVRIEEHWHTISGRIQFSLTGPVSTGCAGDEVELVGWLEAPQGSANPGGADLRAALRDQRIRAILNVRHTTDVLTVQPATWPGASRRWLGRIRGWCREQLRDAIPEHSGLAVALLLGDSTGMTQADWDKYRNTGVIHVLAISGQHLILLSACGWWLLRLAGVRRGRGALGIALVLVGYTLLVSGRAPVVRAAVIVCTGCLGTWLRRQTLTANSFALAWLIVLALNPTDLFTAGCQLSFLGTAMLYWFGMPVHHDTDPLMELVAKSRPWWVRMGLSLWEIIRRSYLTHAVIFLALLPLMAAHFHTLPFSALLVGPLVCFLTGMALLFGFLVLFLKAILPPAGALVGQLAAWCLSGCEALVVRAEQLESLRWHVGDVPLWWLAGFYVGLLGVLTLQTWRVRRRWFVPTGAAWFCLGLLGSRAGPVAEELRCTFLSVGHGVCVVLELPDGRVFLYDVGAMSGPDVVRRHLAPYLWHRGLRRVDEVFLSHADLDHFNGLPALLERFAVGQVTLTPSFASRRTLGVQAVLEAFQRRRIPTRVVQAGDRLVASSVTVDVLHPPPAGPEGAENARSLVLLIEHAGRRILLTGDLEGAGLYTVLSRPRLPVDVLMAPHHGSRTANTPELANWASPRVVLSSQAFRYNRATLAAPYVTVGAQFLDTAEHGAVTVRSCRGHLLLETHRTAQRISLASAPASRQ